MAAKRRTVRITLASLAVIAGTAAVCFANSSLIVRAYNEWRIATGPERSFGFDTVASLWAARNRIEVYDLRRGSAPVYTTTLSDVRNLSLQYICHPADLKMPGRFEVHAPKGAKDPGYGMTLFALAVDVPAGVTVDARHPNVYEAESGTRANFTFGTVFHFKGSSGDWADASLSDASAVPPATFSDPIRVVIRPDMSSSIWNMPGEKIMLARNGYYYTSAFHPASGISPAELEYYANRNPPYEDAGGMTMSSSVGMPQKSVR